MVAFNDVSVIKQLSLELVVLIGHSMGGLVVVEVARFIPDRIRGILGVDTFQDLNYKGGMQIPLDKMLPYFHADFVKASREIVTSMFLETSDPVLIEKIVTDMSSAPPSIGIGAFEGILNYDLARAIEHIKVPIRCICSDWVPFDLEAAQRHASDFKVTFMSEVGHFVMLEDPATFNSLL